MNPNAESLLASATEAAKSTANWADLSNFLFDPSDGLISKAFPTQAEREAFMKTNEYQAIRSLLLDLMKRSGLVNGSAPQKSGRFVVRVPKSLHAALEREAANEGVSLNQLVVTKLAVQMSQIQDGPNAEMAAVAQAYLESRDGYSTDRVIADPDMNRRFLHRCRELGVVGTDYELNWKLMYARKNSYLSSMPKTRRYSATHIDDFEFSSEIALVHVKHQVEEQRRVITLDKVLCDPELARLFDEIAEKLAPGFSPLDYRWAALRVRKAAGRSFRQVQKASLPAFDFLGPTNSIRPSRVTTEQGIYFFRCEDESLFVSHTDNLRRRIERHFDSSNSRGVPDWLYDSGSRSIHLGIVPMPRVTTGDRKIVELKAVSTYEPLLNVPAGTKSKNCRLKKR
jgi:site-specific DNA-methyltransferase (adenine-specific)